MVSSTDSGSTVLLEVSGEVDADSVGELRDKVLSCLVRGRPAEVIVDLRRVTLLDSAALGTLVGCHRAAEAAGARLVLRDPPAFVRRVIFVTGLGGLFGLAGEHTGQH